MIKFVILQTVTDKVLGNMSNEKGKQPIVLEDIGLRIKL